MSIFPSEDRSKSVLPRADPSHTDLRTQDAGTKIPSKSAVQFETEEDTNFTAARLYYQPQVTSDGRTIIGVECLLRSVDADGRVFGPQTILGKIGNDIQANALDWWVIRQACRDGLRWPQLTISINISARPFQSPDFAGELL